MWLRKILAYAVFLAVAATLTTLFFGNLHREKTIAEGACLALRPEVQMRDAPPFSLPGLDGKKLSIADLKGKVVLLHFWATWCPTCLKEIPSFYRLQRAITSKDFKLLTVSVDDSSTIVADFFAKQHAPPLPVVIDASAKVAASYGTTQFPESYLIDKSGKVRYRFVNKRDWGSATALACLRSQLN